MRFELTADGIVYGAFTLVGNKVTDMEGQAELLPEIITIHDGGKEGDIFFEFERPAENEDEALQKISEVFWSLEIKPVLEEENA